MEEQPVRNGAARRNQRRFPWLALVLLLGTIYLFWILPQQLGPRPIKVIFESDSKVK